MKTYTRSFGNHHRVNGPAFEWSDGDYAWYYNDRLHRYYGPARRWIGIEDYFIFGEEME